ncbi:hypothetical protein COCNU_12G002490 [Cocos nucifera]|uniref:Sodium/calcium exchanger membrane region domain-containing protein n=1 Tax=Cocos nucifera TaxID=13894 RepID=A0A8K0IR45_COCNU|nr:hypothetical protein COCNU_12G002490 [Cocos nucifera]
MYMAGSNVGNSSFSRDEICESYLLFHGETFLSNGLRAFLYLLALACCFIGLSAITARFFRSMENIVKQTRCIVEIDSCTNAEVIKYEKFWNYTIADISLLAFGTSFPQISLATIDAIRNLGQLDAGGPVYQNVPENDMAESSTQALIKKKIVEEDQDVLLAWGRQFLDSVIMDSEKSKVVRKRNSESVFVRLEVDVFVTFKLESTESKKIDNVCLRMARIFWQLSLALWRLLSAFVPPYQIAHGWISFICSLIFISGIAYVVTQLTDQISCDTGINPYVIAFTALASGTSWPDLVSSKIAAERQVTADSAIANITCRLSHFHDDQVPLGMFCLYALGWMGEAWAKGGHMSQDVASDSNPRVSKR